MPLRPIFMVPRLLALLALVLAPLAYAGKPAAAPAAPATPPASPFPRADLRASEVTWTVLLFHTTEPQADVVAGARKLLAAKYPQLGIAPPLDKALAPGKAPAPARKAEAVVRPVSDKDLEPIDEDELQYFGRTMDAEERKRLVRTRSATELSFRAPFEQRQEMLLAASRFAHQLAAEHGAFLWDAETREYFSARSWKEARLEGWSGGVPFLPAHITLHVYKDGEGVRVISLGMAKLGLPDLVVEQVPGSLSVDMGRLVNAVAQLMAEGLTLSADGTLEVNLAKLKDGKLRGQLDSRVQKGAARRVKLQALRARRDEGDPDNVLLELGFPGSGELHLRQVAALDALFGREPDGVTSAPPGDPELEAVARKARARLMELRERVERGLRPPEQLVIKAPFRTDRGGTEFMWVEVTSWAKGKWRGTLANEPDDVSSLRLGSPVEIAEAEVVDYVYMTPTGGTEGGESARILMRREGQ